MGVAWARHAMCESAFSGLKLLPVAWSALNLFSIGLKDGATAVP